MFINFLNATASFLAKEDMENVSHLFLKER